MALVSGLAAADPTQPTPPTWAFEPGQDHFAEDALLDLAHLNEAMAGETGFVRRTPDGAGFVRGDGTPIRFWAVNSYVTRQGLPALRNHARFLAKRGVNMVRMHGQIPQAGPDGGPLEATSCQRRSRSPVLIASSGPPSGPACGIWPCIR
ncbi:MAG: hypothetical protein AAFR44_08905, partial [Pseudomonadota bacterium]